MSNLKIEKLDSAARSIIESEVAEYQDGLLDEIETKATLNEKEISEVSAKDAYESIANYKYKKYEQTKRRAAKKELIYLLLAVLGVIYSVIGSFYPFFSSTSYRNATLTTDFPAALTLTGSVATLIGLSLIFLARSKRRPNTPTYEEVGSGEELRWRLVKVWTEIERVSAEWSARASLDKTSPMNSIRWLRSSEILKDHEKEQLAKLLNARNSIVHGMDSEFTVLELKRLISFGLDVIERLGNYRK